MKSKYIFLLIPLVIFNIMFINISNITSDLNLSALACESIEVVDEQQAYRYDYNEVDMHPVTITKVKVTGFSTRKFAQVIFPCITCSTTADFNYGSSSGSSVNTSVGINYSSAAFGGDGGMSYTDNYGNTNSVSIQNCAVGVQCDLVENGTLNECTNIPC